jgi:hypothetical protein
MCARGAGIVAFASVGFMYIVPIGTAEGVIYGFVLGVLVRLVNRAEQIHREESRHTLFRRGLWLLTIGATLSVVEARDGIIPLGVGALLTVLGVALPPGP